MKATREIVESALQFGPASVATICERMADWTQDLPSEAWVRAELGVLSEQGKAYRSSVGLWTQRMAQR